MGNKSVCQGATAVGNSAGLPSVSLLWATVIAVSPWLPMAVGIVDMTGVTVILSMLICGFLPSFLLGALLGRARACWALATCGALGPSLWILDFTLFSDPDVHSSVPVAVAITVTLAFGFVCAPLIGGAIAGRWCSCPRAAR
jgi:hypothetical protein